MRKLIAWVVLLCGFMPVLWAADGCDQHLSREEFRAKQKAFIIEQAGLSKEEAAKFFSVYFELQDKKKKLNDESWDLMRKGKDDKTTEAQYAEINDKIANNRIAADQLLLLILEFKIDGKELGCLLFTQSCLFGNEFLLFCPELLPG